MTELATRNKPFIENVMLEDVRIMFRNFAGKEDQYNREGDRNFVALLPDPVAEQMRRDGWNIKVLHAREEGDVDQPYIPIAVSYRHRAPAVVLITSGGRTNLSEKEVAILDFAEIANVDLIINPYSWSKNGKSGVKAYLKSIFVTIEEDELEKKYSKIPELDRGGRPMQAIEAAPMEDLGELEVIEGEYEEAF